MFDRGRAARPDSEDYTAAKASARESAVSEGRSGGTREGACDRLTVSVRECGHGDSVDDDMGNFRSVRTRVLGHELWFDFPVDLDRRDLFDDCARGSSVVSVGSLSSPFGHLALCGSE